MRLENKEIGKRSLFVQAADSLGQQRSAGKHFDFITHRAGCCTEWRNTVRGDEPLDRWMHERLAGAFHQEGMCDEGEELFAPRTFEPPALL